MGEYIPRLTDEGMLNNPFWYSNNPFYQSGFGLPNCTCYAWGRLYELNREPPQTSLGDAQNWFEFNKNNGVYPYGNTPQLGSIICFYNNATGGHVGVVEKIEGNTITTSNSAYGGAYFYLQTLEMGSESHGNYTFQGYIYAWNGSTPIPPIKNKNDLIYLMLSKAFKGGI